MNLCDPNLLKRQLYLGGRWQPSTSNKTFPVLNPANGELLAEVADATETDAFAAITAAKAAWPTWRMKTGKERATLLRAWFNLILQHTDDLAELMTAEQGKPLAESKGEVTYGASFIEWFAEEAKRAYGDTIPGHVPNARILTIKQPIGICAAITPWNFPIAMIARKAGAALAAGCPMIVKPAGETPLSALAMAELADRAGIPAGVLSVLPTSKSAVVGGVLTTHVDVRKVSFTGSTEVGKILMKQAADTVKKVSMELGGNAPFIVFDDADIDAAVLGAMASKFRNTGQTCVCANRIFVQDVVYDEFAQKLAAKVKTLIVGPGDQRVDQGPLINAEALERVEQLVAQSRAAGAKVLAGGRRHALGGTFYEPTVLCDVTPEMAISHEEIFGPVAPLYRFKSDDEVIELANATPFGLAAYFYAANIARVWRVAEALEYGMVGINTGIISTEVAPFGGIKESGIGREGSKYGLDEYLELKYLCLGGIDQ